MTANLHPKHRQELEVGSGISPEVIAARGAYTATTRADLEALGYKDYQIRVPALVLPEHLLNGWKPTHHIKPDRPRTREVKPDGTVKYQKYDRPEGSANRLDVPPTVRDKVLDYNDRLVFTEGWKKADAAASHGIAVVALSGVWNFAGRTEDGWTAPLEDFRHIPLKKPHEPGRRVVIAFDSDVATNKDVRDARERFRHLLLGYGARVQYVDLPPLPDGSKCGLDDFLLTHSAEDLWALAYDPEDKPEDKQDRELARLRAQLREVQARESALVRLAANKDTRKLLPVAVRATAELDIVKAKEDPTEQGDYRLSLSRVRGVVYDDYGKPKPEVPPICSENTVSSHLEEIAKIVPDLKLDKRPGTVTLRRKDPNTGQKIVQEIPSTLTYARWEGTSTDLLNALADYRSDQPERRGGKRCPDCGSDRVKTIHRCLDCGSLFDQPAQEVIAEPPPPDPPTDDTPLYSLYERAQRPEAPASNFEAGSSNPLPTHSISLAAMFEGGQPETPAAKFETQPIQCRVGLFGYQCYDPDRCAKAGRCTP